MRATLVLVAPNWLLSCIPTREVAEEGEHAIRLGGKDEPSYLEEGEGACPKVYPVVVRRGKRHTP